MVTCIECHQPFTAGRDDKRFCSGKCRMRYHRRQKSAQAVNTGWRQQMSFLRPMAFSKSENYSKPTIDKGLCWVPPHLWHEDLELLNQLHSLRSVLKEFDGLHGQEYEPLPPDEGEGLDELDQSLGAGMLCWVEEMERYLEDLRGGRGRMGQRLGERWTLLEPGLARLRRHVQRFSLGEPLGVQYTVAFEADFVAHLRDWPVELGLLWLDLEAQTR